ncbi:MAG: AAA family ATPase [Syntrophaceae bacterium]|nr:AAA family ATPase [Syntrophaceae bacterium]
MPDIKLLKPSDSVNFWKKENSFDLGYRIPFITKYYPDSYFGGWPGGDRPRWDEVCSELEASRMAFIRTNRYKDGDGYYLRLLTGRFVLNGSIILNDNGNLRLHLNKSGIEFANNKKRRDMVVYGTCVNHNGIFLRKGAEFRNMFESKFPDPGEKIEQLKRNCENASDNSVPDDELSEEETTNEISESEEHLLRTLEMFIDSEYELEQQIAQSEPGFAYVKIVPETRQSIVRKYYRITILEQDYRRLREGRHTMVIAKSSDGQDIQLQIENLNADSAKGEIIVSTLQQLSAGQLPESGQLKLVAIDTLKTVRRAVVEKFRKGTGRNPWLVKLAIDSYQHSPVKPAAVKLSPGEFPPNQSQLHAINAGASTNDYMLVLGPPGTGKTTVICKWVEHFVSQGKRVLISSQNNKAVDNVLERVAKNEDLTCVRVGNESKISSVIHHLLIDNSATDLQRRLITTLDERMFAIEYALNLIKRLMILLVEDAPLEKLFSLSMEISEHIEKNMSALGSFVIGNDHEDILSGINSLKLRSKDYEALVSRQQEYSSKKGWLRPFYQIASLCQKFKSKRLFVKIQSEKQNLLPVMETKTKQTEALLNEIRAWHKNISTVRQESLYPILLQLVDVVGATCIGINTSRFFEDTEFDIVIIDESGQIQLHNLIVPLSRAKHVILVGDHKQLPPVVEKELIVEIQSRAETEDFEIQTELINKSWFEVLWDRAPANRKVMLKTQFRCPALISDFISEAFYDKQYYAGEPMKKKLPIFSFFKSTMVFLDTSKIPFEERSEQYREIGQRIEVLGNNCETKILIKLLLQILNEKPELGITGEIGIIVPYANHVRQIQQAIIDEQKCGRLMELITPVMELVASVDSYQGQERDLIIFMFTRSNKRKSIGFLKDWRRLNVAMTRTKKQLVMIGDLSTLAADTNPERDDFEFKKVMKELEIFINSKGQLIRLSDSKIQDQTKNY